MLADDRWTSSADGRTRIHLRSWASGLQWGIAFGVLGGLGIGAFATALGFVLFG